MQEILKENDLSDVTTENNLTDILPFLEKEYEAIKFQVKQREFKNKKKFIKSLKISIKDL